MYIAQDVLLYLVLVVGFNLLQILRRYMLLRTLAARSYALLWSIIS